MNIYILIATFIGSYSAQVTTIEFNSESSCQTAAHAYIAVLPKQDDWIDNDKRIFLCVKK